MIIAPSVVEDRPATDGNRQDEEEYEAEEGQECVICLVSAITTKLMPCGHAHFCQACAALIFAGAVDENPRCPCCRLAVTGIAEVVLEEVQAQQVERTEAIRDANPYAIILMAHRRGSHEQLLLSSPAATSQQAVGIPGLSLLTGVRSADVPPLGGSSVISPALTTLTSRASQVESERLRRKGKGKGKSGLQARALIERDDQADWYTPWWPMDSENEPEGTYHAEQLGAHEVAILPDTGAHDNLCGDAWAQKLAQMCIAAGVQAEQRLLQHPKQVRGVGAGPTEATYEVELATGTMDTEGNNIMSTYVAPCLPQSSVPGLMGIKSLKVKDALIRCRTGEMWFLGQGGVEIRTSPGTKHFQMKESPGGHWMLPVSTFLAGGKTQPPRQSQGGSSSSQSQSATWAASSL